MNISPVEGYTFSLCWSIHNIQVLKGSSGCAKYVYKHIEKVDEKNYVVVEIYCKVKFITKAVFLHNKKIGIVKYGRK